jgi:biotin carboxylase
MRAALASCQVHGIATNLELHAALLRQPELAHGGVDTGYLSRALPRLLPASAA